MDTAGTFTLKLSNPASRQINITGMSVTVGATTAAVNYAIGILSAGAGTDTLSTAQAAFGSQTTGSKYAAKVAINYTDMNSGLAYSTTGTITGKVV